MILSKVISTALAEGLRRVKVACFGLKDARTATQLAPFGVDSNPLPNIRVVYANTAKAGNSYIIGCVNINNQADPGEFRAYSLKEDGDLSTYIWLHKTPGPGQIELGGTDYSAVRYQPLNTGMQNFKSQINTQLTLIQSAISTLGGTYARTDVSVDISAAENDKIKTI